MQALKKGTYRIDPGDHYGTPKEVYGFKTRATTKPARTIAKQMLTANHALLGLDMALSDLKAARLIQSLGARHIIFQQHYANIRVHRAYVTVHMDNKGRIYLVKNRAVPADKFPKKTDFPLAASQAVANAVRSFRNKPRAPSVLDSEQMWFPQNGRIVPAWRIRLVLHRPREEWIIFVHARTGKVISSYDNLALSPAGRAWVFDPSPVTTLGDHAALISNKRKYKKVPDEAYRKVSIRDLDTTGYLEGKRVSTRPMKKQRIRRRDHVYELRSNQHGFEQVMAYHHINEAIRYLERLGYRGRKAIFNDPVKVNATGTDQDNSWYSPYEKQLTFGTGYIDDAEDAETILHEFGHALQDTICPGFGQSHEAAAIGEGFSDYFAASFFADRKPERYQHCVMTWDGLLIGLDEGLDPPCLRQLKNSLTYNDFIARVDHEHTNGEIWSAALWRIREQLGRDVADRIIIESHFQLDGFTSLLRAARAIIDADNNLYQGRHRETLRKIFRRRGIQVKS